MTTAVLAPRIPTWTRIDDGLTSGSLDGDYAGMIERIGPRWIARDAFGTIVGRFSSEADARAALEPAAVAAAHERMRRREQRIAGITAAAAAATSLLAAAGFLTLAGV